MATSFTPRPALQINSGEQNCFTEKLMAKIFSFYDEQSLIDVTFKVSNPTALVPAHRLVLAAASPYFENLFNSDQGNNPVLEINDIDSDIFERLITFCYFGQTLITLNTRNVGAMLKAAIMLQLDDAITSCLNYLMSHINEYSLQGVYTLERETQCKHLMQKIIEYETQNFVEISQSYEFLQFDVEKMKRILKSENLNRSRQEDVFDAIKRWFNYDVPARQEQLPLLIACLRLTHFDANFLLTHIQPLPGCETLEFKAISRNTEPAGRTKTNMRFTGPRGASAANCGEKTLLAVCSGLIPKLLQYNKAEDKWHVYATINNDYNQYTTILKDDNIFFIGGGKHCKALNIVRGWNIRNKTWQHFPAMNKARCSHCVVELDSKIYAISGFDGTNVLSSVERYTTSDGWKFVNSLIVGRCDAGAVTLNDKIYIMGGFWGGQNLKSVECYNEDSNTWTSCANMIESHILPGVAAHKDHIYVLGDNGNNRTVERYNPQQNTWSKICSLEVGFGFLACVSLDNKLWTLGGNSGSQYTRTYKKSVSVYDEENDRWEQKCILREFCIYSCFVVPVDLLTSNE